ncbi:MAG TPA: cytochrome P450, partial [Ktedonobacteraceae bacterium]|nr:cytochrome P450 [Ktedonobacteraceae bacterium]
AKPQADILTHLINAEIDGEHLSHQDLLNFCFTLFIAGNITTTNTLGGAMILFDEHPDAFADLRLHPDVIPLAVEEILRCIPPGRIAPSAFIDGRVATTRVTMGDQTIQEGDRVLTITLANNFDESAFETPERFDIRRHPNRHVSFGHGIHFCLGAPLARLEMKIALERVIQRLPDIHRAEHGPIEVVESNILFGPKHLPLAFSPQG